MSPSAYLTVTGLIPKAFPAVFKAVAMSVLESTSVPSKSKIINLIGIW